LVKEKRRKEAVELGKVLTGRGAGQSFVSFAPDQVIYAQGDPADAMFYVQSGRVKISVVTPSGKEAVIAIRGPGEFFGSRCLVARRTGTLTALTACSLIRVTKAALIRLLREEPDFAVMFATYLVGQSIQDQENLVDHLTNPAEKRLARALLELAKDPDGEGSHPISTPINQAVLANMVGTTRSRINFFMNKFKRQGLIEYDRQGRVSVRNSLRRAILEE
jgi:CRP/FNR family transcriptional regulator, cyclic AMP receptor protein